MRYQHKAMYCFACDLLRILPLFSDENARRFGVMFLHTSFFNGSKFFSRKYFQNRVNIIPTKFCLFCFLNTVFELNFSKTFPAATNRWNFEEMRVPFFYCIIETIVVIPEVTCTNQWLPCCGVIFVKQFSSSLFSMKYVWLMKYKQNGSYGNPTHIDFLRPFY